MADIASVFGRHEFLIRRLHSLTGLVPVGGFLVIHLLTNLGVLDNSYQQRVDLIHSMGDRTLEVTEWSLIFLPILFHGIIGLIIVARGKRNLSYYPYRENFRYTLQRWTGVIAFAFIAWHVFQTRGWINSDWWLDHVTRPLGGGLFKPKDAVDDRRLRHPSRPWVASVYAIGVLASVYHLANGLWTMGITWGVWTGPRSQRWASVFCAAFGVALAAAGLAALYGFWFYHPLTKTCNGETFRDDHRRRPGRAGRGHETGRTGVRRQPHEPPAASNARTAVCAQGGINSVNDLTRQLGDSEWKHFDDTVYGGDFLQHQPPVKELAYWAPKIIDLMDRLGVTFNRTPEGFRDQRRFGGTLYQRTAFAGATTGPAIALCPGRAGPPLGGGRPRAQVSNTGTSWAR